jgi:hypothetical protein
MDGAFNRHLKMRNACKILNAKLEERGWEDNVSLKYPLKE